MMSRHGSAGENTPVSELRERLCGLLVCLVPRSEPLLGQVIPQLGPVDAIECVMQRAVRRSERIAAVVVMEIHNSMCAGRHFVIVHTPQTKRNENTQCRAWFPYSRVLCRGIEGGGTNSTS